MPYIEDNHQANWKFSLEFTVLEAKGIWELTTAGIIGICRSISIIAMSVTLLNRRRKKLKNQETIKI